MHNLDPITEPLRGLRRVLREAGYDEQATRRAAAAGDPLRQPAARAAAQGLALGSDTLSRLLALFWLGESVDAAAVANIDPPGLQASGLVRLAGDRVVPLVRIDEIDGAYVCSDLSLDQADAIAPVSPSTRLSAAFTPRPKIAAALDLCAGSGAHALLAARHAERVVATDIAPRAKRADPTQRGAERSRQHRDPHRKLPRACRRRALRPRDRHPPYVISPDHDFLYRDAGLPDDEPSRTLLAELPRPLQDGGYGCLQGNWIHRRDEPWYRPLGRCLRGAGCDALLIRYATWNRSRTRRPGARRITPTPGPAARSGQPLARELRSRRDRPRSAARSLCCGAGPASTTGAEPFRSLTSQRGSASAYRESLPPTTASPTAATRSAPACAQPPASTSNASSDRASPSGRHSGAKPRS